MKKILITLLVFSVSAIVFAEGKTYYADPVKGSMSNDGSEAKPWKTLEEIVKNGNIKQLKPGDTLLLRSGKHGSVSLEGNNSEVITIAADKDCKPQLSYFEITRGSKWTIKGLVISPSFGKPYDKNIVVLAESGESSDLVLEDCFIYTTLDNKNWTKDNWMKANSGIFMGRNGTRITLRNNYVLNTRFGIAMCSFDSLAEGNVVSDFSADGMRITRDGETAQYNVIKNGYVGGNDGDKNHDDGMQCFLFNVGTGMVRNVTVRGNIIINREDPRQRFATSIQGIGFFDGPLVDFVVEGNAVLVDHWHGITLCDAQNCRISDNAVFTIWFDKMKPWISLGEKQNLAKGNTVMNNMACEFVLKGDKTAKAKNNETVTQGKFKKAFDNALKVINEKFGEVHQASGKKRVENPDLIK